MMTSRVAAVILLLAGAGSPAAAECSQRGGTVRDFKRHTPFVFEGTVTRLSVVSGHDEAAIEAYRVWKGKVTPEVSVHFLSNIDGPSFTVGSRYLIFGVPETDAQRRFDPSHSEIHEGMIWVNPCSGPIPVSPKLIEQLGRSRKPS
jgi:hypothetical protein